MKKKRIVFLPVPENLIEYLELSNEAQDVFNIDPSIPIPVEIPEDEDTTPENLSLQTILSGMLRVIEEGQARQEWLDYYSSFVLYLRPDILNIIKEMKESGLNDENFLKANKLIREGKAEEGLSAIRGFIEKRPRVWNGWFLLGWALRLLGRWQDALSAFNKAIELGGDNSDTRNELAICLMETGDASGAQRELETALKEDGENVKIISNLGVLALKNGEKEKASAFFRTVLEIDKDDPVAKQYLEKI
jgi:Flp pilus assembly protein TadD